MPVKQRKIVVVRYLVWCLCGVLVTVGVSGVQAQEPALLVPLFRLFLVDGGEVSTYGEFARVDGQVVASVPVGEFATARGETPPVQMVTIDADRIDWTRTDAYTRTVRLAQYTASTAERDYVAFTQEVARTLDQVSSTADPLTRIVLVERARRRLADWPRDHFGYRQRDAEGSLAVLDDVLAGLRAAAGQQHFTLALATGAPPVTSPPPLRPAPTLRDIVTQALGLARHLAEPGERVQLLGHVLGMLERDGTWSRAWVRQTRREARRLLDDERKTTRAYTALRERMVQRAASYVATADVRAMLALRTDLLARDDRLGRRRPAEMTALLAHLDSELEEARAFRLDFDRWQQRKPALDAYAGSATQALARFSPLEAALDDIRTLAGPALHELDRVDATLAGVQVQVRGMQAPDEAAATHALFASALQMTASAARTRRIATLSGDIAKAWEASAAAAGALMMLDRIRTDLVQLTKPPRPGEAVRGASRR